jgi:hypothetical protein
VGGRFYVNTTLLTLLTSAVTPVPPAATPAQGLPDADVPRVLWVAVNY